MKHKIRVHIADDHKILIEGIIAVINTEDDIEVVDYSLTGKEVLDWLDKHTTDILILDINMPVIGGVDVLKKLEKEENSPKVIVLSSYDDVRFVQEIITMGASGFLSKNSAGEHIITAIREVNAGNKYLSKDLEKELFNLMFGKEVKIGIRPEKETEATTSLSDREIDILRLIVQEHNSSEIAEILILSVHTIDSYRKSLLKKINVKNMVGLTKFALKHGII
jgi:DNA-binding NarL/FixJ family response regulator